MTWGDKMTKAEIDDIFGEFEIDEDYMIKSKDVIGLFVAVKEEEKKEEAPTPVEEGRQVNGYFSISMKPQRPGAFLYKLDVRTAFCWRVGRVLMPTSARLSLHS